MRLSDVEKRVKEAQLLPALLDSQDFRGEVSADLERAYHAYREKFGSDRVSQSLQSAFIAARVRRYSLSDILECIQSAKAAFAEKQRAA